MQAIGDLCYELDMSIEEFLLAVIDKKILMDEKIYDAIISYADYLVENDHPRLYDHEHAVLILVSVSKFPLKNLNDFRTLHTLTLRLRPQCALFHLERLVEKLLTFAERRVEEVRILRQVSVKIHSRM
jgi:hypothetical protein